MSPTRLWGRFYQSTAQFKSVDDSMPQAIREPSDPLTLAAAIVAAFVANNHLPAAELQSLIESVHAAVAKLGSATVIWNSPADLGAIGASVRGSITPDYLVCFEDGLKFRSLRRHLRALGLTPEGYRAKWRLPADYPMVSPNYAAKRSELAKRPRMRRPHAEGGPRKL